MSKENITWQVVIDFNDSSLNNALYGIVNGIMYLTTGEDYTFSGNTYVASLLTRDSIPNHYQYIDVKQMGGYASFSNITVKVDLTTGLLSFLQDAGVIIRGSEMILSVSFDHGAPETLWVGKLNGYLPTRSHLHFHGADAFNTIHSNQPSEPIKNTDPTSESTEVVPLIVGKNSTATMKFKSKAGGIAFDLESNSVSNTLNNVKILGWDVAPTRQAFTSDNRMFMPVNWGSLVLFCGSNNNISTNDLVDYVLTFKNELSDDQFFARIISNTASYQVSGSNGGTGGAHDSYGVSVMLDKAVPYDTQFIPDDELNWDLEDNTNDTTKGVTRVGDIEPFASYNSNLFNVGGVPQLTEGRRVHFAGREWVLKDFSSYPAYSNAQYPLNVPADFPYSLPGHGSPQELIQNDGYVMWLPGERISKFAFKPMSIKTIDSAGNEVVQNAYSNYPFNEPLVWASLVPSIAGLEYPYNDFIQYDPSTTTLASLIHVDNIATFIGGANSEEQTFGQPTSDLYTDSGDLIERKFLVEYGELTTQGPEWVNRIMATKGGDLSSKVPVATNHRFISQGLADDYMTFKCGLSLNSFYNGDRKDVKNLLTTSPVPSQTTQASYGSGSLGVDVDKYTSNRANTFGGSSVKYFNAFDYTYPIEYRNGVCPTIAVKSDYDSSYPLIEGYKSHSWARLDNVNFTKTNSYDNSEFNFLCRVMMYKDSEGGGVDYGNDTLSVEAKIEGFDGAVGNKGQSTKVSDSGFVSLYSANVSASFWDTAVASTVLVKIGTLSQDINGSNHPNLILIPCVLPDSLKKSVKGSWYSISIQLRVDSTKDIRMGVWVNYVSMIEYKDNSTLDFTDINRFDNDSSTSYSKGVWTVFSDFDKDLSMFGNSSPDEVDDFLVSKGGGVPAISEQFLAPVSTFSLCSKYAKRGFFGIVADSQGRRYMKPWLYNTTPSKAYATVIPSGSTQYAPIIDRSLADLSITPYSMLFTEGTIHYGVAVDGGTTDYFKIANTDLSSFPDSDSYTSEDVATNERTGNLSHLYTADATSVLHITLPSIPSTWSVGGIIKTVKDSTGEVALLQVKNINQTTGEVFFDFPLGVFSISIYGESVTMLLVSGVLNWSTCISSSENVSYADAKSIWESFHNAYIRRAGHNDIPTSLSEVPELLPSANASNVIEYLKNIIAWDTFTKHTTKFRVSITDAKPAELSLLDCVTVKDPILTRGSNYLGWVYGIKYITSLAVAELEVIFQLDPYDPLLKAQDIDEGVDNMVIVDDVDEVIDNGSGGLPLDNIDEEF